MKLFYHFLIFVFTSLVLIACASLFANENEEKTLNSPSGLERNQNDSVEVSPSINPYIMAGVNYKKLFQEKRWRDNRYYYLDDFYLKNIQTAISLVGYQRY